MTLPNERVNAVKNARQFLYALMDPKLTPRVPRAIRIWARSVLKHYPSDMYLNDIFADSHYERARKRRALRKGPRR